MKTKNKIDLNLLLELLNSSSDAFQVSKVCGQLVVINKEAEKRLGISQKNVSNYHVSDFEEIFAERGCEEWHKHVEEVKEKGNININGFNKNQLTGRIFPVEVNVSYKTIDGTGYIIAVSRDVSEKNNLYSEIINQQKAISSIYLCFQKIMANENFISSIDAGVDSVAEFLNISKANLYLFNKEKMHYQMAYVYCSKLIDKNKDVNKQIVFPTEFNQIKEKIINRTPTLIDNGCPFIPDQEKTEEQRSILCYFLPLFDENTFVGFIKIDEYRKNNKDVINRIEKYKIYSSIINSSYSLYCRKRELSINNRNFRNLNKSINDSFFLFNLDKKKYVFISPACEKIFGQTQEEFYENEGCTPSRIFPQDQTLIKDALIELHHTNFVTKEFRIIHTDGSIRFIQIKAYAIRNLQRELIEVSGIHIDITSKKIQEKIIQESNSQIFHKNQELELKNNHITELINKLETDLYLKSVRFSNTLNLINNAKSEIDTFINKNNNIGSRELNRIVKHLDEIASDEAQLWEEIQIEYEKIRPNFFKGLQALNESITTNELKHCYHLITGLTTKEVANLLNVSARSVETARYRIKKKFNLPKESSLLQFLSNF